MTFRILAIVTVSLVLFVLPLCGLAHEVGLPKQEQQAHAEKPAVQATQDLEDTEAHIEKALDEKLAPIRSELREIRAELERPGLAEIVGGIGWIVGILGILAYMKSRKGSR